MLDTIESWPRAINRTQKSIASTHLIWLRKSVSNSFRSHPTIFVRTAMFDMDKNSTVRPRRDTVYMSMVSVSYHVFIWSHCCSVVSLLTLFRVVGAFLLWPLFCHNTLRLCSRLRCTICCLSLLYQQHAANLLYCVIRFALIRQFRHIDCISQCFKRCKSILKLNFG